MYVVQVIGRGEFPVDMLRRDQAYPATESDSDRIGWRVSPLESLEKRCVTVIMPKFPTSERWESFGWKIHKLNKYDY